MATSSMIRNAASTTGKNYHKRSKVKELRTSTKQTVQHNEERSKEVQNNHLDIDKDECLEQELLHTEEVQYNQVPVRAIRQLSNQYDR